MSDHSAKGSPKNNQRDPIKIHDVAADHSDIWNDWGAGSGVLGNRLHWTWKLREQRSPGHGQLVLLSTLFGLVSFPQRFIDWDFEKFDQNNQRDAAADYSGI